MTPQDSQRAEMTPRENVLEALHFYQADSDMDSHGVNHIFISFPDMYHAAAWARAMGISNQVRYIAPENNLKKYLSNPVRVLYEF